MRNSNEVVDVNCRDLVTAVAALELELHFTAFLSCEFHGSRWLKQLDRHVIRLMMSPEVKLPTGKGAGDYLSRSGEATDDL